MPFDFIPRESEIDPADVARRLAKRKRGQTLLDHRDKTAKEKAAEQKLMRQCLALDERKCRVPRCEYAGRKLPIDPCHKIHRGIGGNPKGDRTTLETLIALCRVHHGEYDHGELEIDEQTPKGFRGPCDYYAVDHVTGELRHIGSDKVIGVSETRGL
jgi:hypothetical protein